VRLNISQTVIQLVPEPKEVQINRMKLLYALNNDSGSGFRSCSYSGFKFRLRHHSFRKVDLRRIEVANEVKIRNMKLRLTFDVDKEVSIINPKQGIILTGTGVTVAHRPVPYIYVKRLTIFVFWGMFGSS